ncbi:PACE efflux transporter [Verminephrobacter eiseniae]|uniref:PACE efflux transporter n=1 Tax=Verminephrobacter eiseniae TaxID=364317 RepID=UPI002238F52E|nr:PACE efflux transporter [Verminephrobacter eiseniae]
MKTPVPNPGPGLQGLWRRVIYVTLYELIAIVVVTAGLTWLTGQSAGHSGVVAVATSAIAVLWNLLFNWAFEHWESRQTVRGRNVRRRIAHAVGFEGGLVVILVPILAWWFGISLWQAFVMDLALVIFFLGYTFVFNWMFDQLFGLPASAARASATPVSAARPGKPGRRR